MVNPAPPHVGQGLESPPFAKLGGCADGIADSQPEKTAPESIPQFRHRHLRLFQFKGVEEMIDGGRVLLALLGDIGQLVQPRAGQEKAGFPVQGHALA